MLGNTIFWLLVTLISSTVLFLFFGQNYDGTWITFFVRQFPIWFLWMLVTPIVFWAVRKMKTLAFKTIYAVVVHLFLVALVSFFFHLLYNAYDLISSDKGFSVEYLVTNSSRGFVLNFIGNLLIYFLIAAVAYGLAWYQALKQSQLEKSELERQLVQAQLDALNMQLRPHFLFNALNSISGLVRKKENKLAVQAISDLGDLLRQSLKQQQYHLISLEEELAFIDKYMEIECLRHQDRLVYLREISADSLPCQIPAFILQPLVENAIVHGISQSPHHGKLTIKSHCPNGSLLIEITDNGVGIAKELDSVIKGVGLSNVENRLRCTYGESFDFQLNPLPEGGTVATLSIPKKL